jgi:uncharacterized membrane protein
MRRPLSFAALAAVAWIWVAAIVAAPHADPTISAATYLTGSLICHQRSDRSFHVAGVRLPVCARCTGLYAGGALGVTLWPLLAGVRRRASTLVRRLATPAAARNTLLVVAAPTAITLATATIGVWDPANAARAALAVPLGCGIGAVISAAVAGDLR